MALAILLGVLVTVNSGLLQERINSFVSRWHYSPPPTLIGQQFHWAFRQQPGLFGKGLGRATSITRHLGPTKLVTTFHPKLLYEIGLLGCLAFLVIVTSLTFLTFKAYCCVRDKNLRVVGVSFWSLILLLSYCPHGYPLDLNPAAVYYWFFAGVTLKLPEIEQGENNINNQS
ncbi:MAG: hypothetical protein F6K58_11565 [Symploca sp. SIO2E9]|nr:hypothetical protein [Symploca sp. SIO2E9]